MASLDGLLRKITIFYDPSLNYIEMAKLNPEFRVQRDMLTSNSNQFTQGYFLKDYNVFPITKSRGT